MEKTNNTLRVIILLLCTIIVGSAAVAQQVPRASDRSEISAAEALSRYEKLLSATKDPKTKFYLTTAAAPTALAAGDSEKARALALSLLEQATTLPQDWNYGNAIHVGNLVLGQIAFSSDDLAEAKRFLLEAGKSPGSPQMNSFGPNMLLAKEFLVRGEHEVVIQYFDLCAGFWKLPDSQLDEWKAVVLKGGIPDFKANLGYYLDQWRFENWDKLQS